MKILTVDVGGTYIKYAAMNEAANFFERGKIDTPKDSHEKFLSAIVELFHTQKFEGIALSLPGIIDSELGVCITSGALGYNDGKFIVDELNELCGVPVTIENDANCAALAEAKIGSLADVEDGFVLVFGTAVGGAFIKNHEVHRGRNFLAGEVSYMFQSIDEDFSDKKFFGELCSVHKLLKDYAKAKKISAKVNGEEFFQAAEDGEVLALSCLKKFTRRIALQIFNIQMILDPERFAIGGGISARKIFVESIRESLEEVYSECYEDFPHVEVVQAKFQNDANLIGALFTWLSRNFSEQPLHFG